MRLAPEGWPFIWVGLFIDAALVLIWWAWPAFGLPLLVIGALLTIWLFVFFRDPVRNGPRGDHLVISPADGKVISVAPAEESMYLHRTTTRISIFMNVFNVHVNRYPVSGEVEVVHYNPGQFVSANLEKASLINEQSSIGIKGAHGPMLVRQIAGLIARRIVTDSQPGELAKQGDRLGMIRFGSRVDVFVDGARIVVKEGQMVHAGLTVLAEYTS